MTDRPLNVTFHPCQRPLKCRYCPIINKSGKITSHSNGKAFSSMINVNCQSSNLIYVIACKNCRIQYVGRTNNLLLTRFQGQFNDIAHDCDTTVARHLNRCGNNTDNTEFSITKTSFIKSPPDSYISKHQRDREKKRWMRRLTTVMPSGLNLID